MPLSYKEIAEIIKVIDASDCEELVLELDGARLELRRHGAGGRSALADGSARSGGGGVERGSRTVAVPTAPAASSSLEGEGRVPEADSQGEGRHAVLSPMIGTFYRAPSPGEPPFVEVGDRVEPGTPLCLIEVMKLYTTIESEVAGRILEIGVENADMVETGQVLFIIEAD